MQAVRDRAQAILEVLPYDVPNDLVTARALLLAGVAALVEAGVSRDDIRVMAEGDWNAVDEALQNRAIASDHGLFDPRLIQH